MEKPDKPIVIQTAKAPKTLYYLEYEDRKRTNRAYLYPCSKDGVAIKAKINDTDTFLFISSNNEQYMFKGIKELNVESRRMLLACSCKYIFFFDSWETKEQACPNCNRYWKSSDLPQ